MRFLPLLATAPLLASVHARAAPAQDAAKPVVASSSCSPKTPCLEYLENQSDRAISFCEKVLRLPKTRTRIDYSTVYTTRTISQVVVEYSTSTFAAAVGKRTEAASAAVDAKVYPIDGDFWSWPWHKRYEYCTPQEIYGACACLLNEYGIPTVTPIVVQATTTKTRYTTATSTRTIVVKTVGTPDCKTRYGALDKTNAPIPNPPGTYVRAIPGINDELSCCQACTDDCVASRFGSYYSPPAGAIPAENPAGQVSAGGISVGAVPVSPVSIPPVSVGPVSAGPVSVSPFTIKRDVADSYFGSSPLPQFGPVQCIHLMVDPKDTLIDSYRTDTCPYGFTGFPFAVDGGAARLGAIFHGPCGTGKPSPFPAR